MDTGHDVMLSMLSVEMFGIYDCFIKETVNNHFRRKDVKVNPG